MKDLCEELTKEDRAAYNKDEDNDDILAKEMEAEYHSHTNQYDADRKLDAFDLPRDDLIYTKDHGNVRLCRFYRDTGHCYKGDACEDLHAITGPGYRIDGVPIHMLTVAHHEIELPKVNDLVYVRVTACNHPNSFFVVMPQGLGDPSAPEVDRNGEKEKEEKRGWSNEGAKETLAGLERAMTDFYKERRHQLRKNSVKCTMICKQKCNLDIIS